MKYLLSFILFLFISFSASAQKPVGFRADLQSTKFQKLKLRGVSLGLIHKSDWLMQYDLESRNQTPYNLPKGYNGHDLKESFLSHSLSFGRVMPLNEMKSLRIVGKVGIHVGRYTGYDKFTILPKEDDISLNEALNSGAASIILVPISLFDHLDDQTHSYEDVNEKLKGLNGEILLEYQFKKHMVISVGGKWIKNKRISDFGRTIKLGVQF